MSWRRRCWGFIGSQLLTNESQRELLLTWRAGAFVPFKLAFSAKRDGFSARAFHQACDPAAESFVVVRSMNGAVFGGYTSQSWALPAVPSAGASAPAPEGSGSASSSPADSKESKEPASLPPRSLFKVDRRAFLFSLIRLQSTPAGESRFQLALNRRTPFLAPLLLVLRSCRYIPATLKLSVDCLQSSPRLPRRAAPANVVWCMTSQLSSRCARWHTASTPTRRPGELAVAAKHSASACV